MTYLDALETMADTTQQAVESLYTDYLQGQIAVDQLGDMIAIVEDLARAQAQRLSEAADVAIEEATMNVPDIAVSHYSRGD